MELTDIIIEKIRTGGPVSFRDFMEMCLYYPALGYYTSPGNKIGQSGDYYTSPHVSGLFGNMVGKQLEEMWSSTGGNEFTIVEYGGGTGTLCHDILDYCKTNNELFEKINYCIIEKNPVRGYENERKHNPDTVNKIKWIESIRETPGFTGCVLSNEVIDNFAVHSVVMQDELMEVFVDYKNGFIEILQPATEPLHEYLDELGVTLPGGMHTEINLEIIDWIKEIAFSLKKGFVLTIDYGYSSAELYHESRNKGTLQCYYRHTLNDSPFNNIGKQDITAHVNFSALRHWGLKNGLACCGYTDQGHFLHGVGIADFLYRSEKAVHTSTGKNEILQMQTLLRDMGNRFKVLIQQKGMDDPKLSGLKFSHKLS